MAARKPPTHTVDIVSPSNSMGTSHRAAPCRLTRAYIIPTDERQGSGLEFYRSHGRCTGGGVLALHVDLDSLQPIGGPFIVRLSFLNEDGSSESHWSTDPFNARDQANRDGRGFVVAMGRPGIEEEPSIWIHGEGLDLRKMLELTCEAIAASGVVKTKLNELKKVAASSGPAAEDGDDE